MIEQARVELTPELLEQNPLLAAALTGMSMLVIAVLIGSLASWVYLVIKARRGEPWLKAEPRGPRAWGLADLVIVAVLVVVCQTFFASAYVRWSGMELDKLRGEPVPAEVNTVASLGNVLAVGLTLAWLALRYQVSPAHVGFHRQRWLRQLQIAVLATLATLPIVYLMMAAVSIGLDAAYKHPLLDEIRAQATLASYLLGVVTAVLIAPLAEEFLFRVMIQGWLQSWPVSSPRKILLGESPSQRAHKAVADVVQATIVEADSQPAPNSSQETSQPPVVAAPDHPSKLQPAGPLASATGGVGDSLAVIPPLWPAVVTGILFGLAHWGYGLSFIPLIVLGIVLGLMYRATNSIWPCFLMHMALNGTSMLGLGLSILIERAEPIVALLMRLL